MMVQREYKKKLIEVKARPYYNQPISLIIPKEALELGTQASANLELHLTKEETTKLIAALKAQRARKGVR